MSERPIQLKYAKYLTFALAACTVASNSAYLFYLSNHHMVRYWSGFNGILLGLFMGGWSAMLALAGNRWASGVIAAIGLFNLAVGVLFFF
jgi:hypothetical protein